MNPKPYVIRPADRSAAMHVLGTQVTVLTSGTGAHDQRITLQTGSEGTGPPPHSHDWDEYFFVSGGAVQFILDGQSTICPMGTFVHIPAGTVHAFSYGPEGGELVEITGGRSKAIEMFTALAGAMPPGPPDVAKAVEVLGAHGVSVHV